MKQTVRLLLIVVISSCGICAQTFIKPIAGTPDYNGTYTGSPRTGNLRYTTLYRDNQDDGLASGCRGEGCGKHPGVDIAVQSGTSVYVPIAGVVMISRCDTNGWGGLVVIRSAHPKHASQYIYQVFAHLRERVLSNGIAVQPGQYVSAGAIIGRSGGNSKSDPCSGYSTGSHLHYQIDTDDGNPEPYYPPSGSLNYADDTFVVTGRTYNPIVMLQGGYRWSFSEQGNRELWDLYNFQSWGVTNDALFVDGAQDPYIQRGRLTSCGAGKVCSSFIAAESADYQFVELDWYNHCATNLSKLYFITNRDTVWDENKTIVFSPSHTGSFRSRMYVGWHPRWRDTIIGLRVDASEQCQPTAWDPTYFGEIALVR